MNYYFLGIGGIGMSAIARFFHQRGDTVSGYDRTESPLTRQLVQEGIAVHYEDNPVPFTKGGADGKTVTGVRRVNPWQEVCGRGRHAWKDLYLKHDCTYPQ